MNIIRSGISILCFLFISPAFLAAQRQPPAPPQTPRQALVEMINGGGKGVTKHLTVEVQQLLSKPENKQAAMTMGMFESITSQAGPDIQVFETGPVLLSVKDPNQHRKFELNVNNDDMSGDEDTLELSFHMFQDGQEQEEDWSMFLSHITVTMNRQQDIWRLNKVALGVEFPVGDPEFLKKTLLKSMGGGVAGGGMVGGKIGVAPPSAHTELKTTELEGMMELPPSQLLTMLAFAEGSFARQHADVGFTCSLADLTQGGDFGLDRQISGGIYKGYKVNLTGCQGKPAGSFQITIEPVSPGSGGKAYCIDATQNVRASDDGRAATCIAAGTPENMTVGHQSSSVGLDFVSTGSATKPQN
ncbi:MAG TPA: hypothetical protein VKY85_23465 [Candidatus Angelobacter sp.]|nr:hypothetical protein [Candidatus Angelobacter sp.]